MIQLQDLISLKIERQELKNQSKVRGQSKGNKEVKSKDNEEMVVLRYLKHVHLQFLAVYVRKFV